MGWWKAGDDVLVGDEPLDVLAEAVASVVSHYKAKWHRAPNLAEWEQLLGGTLHTFVFENEVNEKGGMLVAKEPDKRVVVKVEIVNAQ